MFTGPYIYAAKVWIHLIALVAHTDPVVQVHILSTFSTLVHLRTRAIFTAKVTDMCARTWGIRRKLIPMDTGQTLVYVWANAGVAVFMTVSYAVISFRSWNPIIITFAFSSIVWRLRIDDMCMSIAQYTI